MPKVDGFEATRRVKEIENNTIPASVIIALTASAEASVRRRCLTSGMDDFIAKPVSKNMLERVFIKWCRSRGLGSTFSKVVNE